MTGSSVFSRDDPPSLEEAIALGRDDLYRLLGEAGRRQANVRRVYGRSLQGRARHIDYCLTEERALIWRAIQEIERRRRAGSEDN